MVLNGFTHSGFTVVLVTAAVLVKTTMGKPNPFGLSPFPKCIIIMCQVSCHVFFATYYGSNKFMYQTV